MFKTRTSQSADISEPNPRFKVRYIGNVLTTFVKGDGCVDRPASTLWLNYRANKALSVEMELTVCGEGLHAVSTKERSLTEYLAHRILYCICHPKYPRLFIWVYRHDGKRLKVCQHNV